MYGNDVEFLRNFFFTANEEDRNDMYRMRRAWGRIETSSTSARALSRAKSASKKNRDTIFRAEVGYRSEREVYFHNGVEYATLDEAISAAGEAFTPNRYLVSRIEISEDGKAALRPYSRPEDAMSMYEVEYVIRDWGSFNGHGFAFVKDNQTGETKIFSFSSRTKEEITKQQFDEICQRKADWYKQKMQTIWPDSPSLSMFKSKEWQGSDLSPAYGKVRQLVSDLLIVREKGNLTADQGDEMNAIIDALNGILESRKQ